MQRKFKNSNDLSEIFQLFHTFDTMQELYWSELYFYYIFITFPRSKDPQAVERLSSLLLGDPSHPHPPNLTLVVAEFVHHRMNCRLPNLALRILTHLAQNLPLVCWLI